MNRLVAIAIAVAIGAPMSAGSERQSTPATSMYSSISLPSGSVM